MLLSFTRAIQLTLAASVLHRVQVAQRVRHLAHILLRGFLDQRAVHPFRSLAVQQIPVLQVRRLVHADRLDGDRVLGREIGRGHRLGTVAAAAHAWRVDLRRLKFDERIQCA